MALGLQAQQGVAQRSATSRRSARGVAARPDVATFAVRPHLAGVQAQAPIRQQVEVSSSRVSRAARRGLKVFAQAAAVGGKTKVGSGRCLLVSMPSWVHFGVLTQLRNSCSPAARVQLRQDQRGRCLHEGAGEHSPETTCVNCDRKYFSPSTDGTVMRSQHLPLTSHHPTPSIAAGRQGRQPGRDVPHWPVRAPWPDHHHRLLRRVPRERCAPPIPRFVLSSVHASLSLYV